VVLEDLHGGETSAAGEELMGELGLVVRLVGLLVVVLTLVWVTVLVGVLAESCDLGVYSPQPNMIADVMEKVLR
jgi:hypothetical protein